MLEKHFIHRKQIGFKYNATFRWKSSAFLVYEMIGAIGLRIRFQGFMQI